LIRLARAQIEANKTPAISRSLSTNSLGGIVSA